MRGKNIPKPVQNWFQCGLSSRVLELLQKSGFAKPMPIQAQALPAIMSGRDCIGIAKTGSGKTLAFVLPMLRHIKDQARLLLPPALPSTATLFQHASNVLLLPLFLCVLPLLCHQSPIPWRQQKVLSWQSVTEDTAGGDWHVSTKNWVWD